MELIRDRLRIFEGQNILWIITWYMEISFGWSNTSEDCVLIVCDIAFYQVFVGARLHVTGGVLRGGRSVEGEASIAGNLPFYLITNYFIVYFSSHFLFCYFTPSLHAYVFFSCFDSIGHCCWGLVGQKWHCILLTLKQRSWLWPFFGAYASLSPCSSSC